MNRQRTLGAGSDPLSTANVIVATDGPHAGLDVIGNTTNIARKPWSVVYDFLYQFGQGGVLFSMMDGLAPVACAAIRLETYDVIAFEADRNTWLAQEVVIKFIQQEEHREKQFEAKMTKSEEVELI